MSQPNATSLLSAEFIEQIERLRIIGRKALAGRFSGEHRTRQLGKSSDFANHRTYVAGDDPRFIDWNVYARLDRLFIKLFTERQDRSLYLLIDASKSCDYGEPSKFRHIQRLVAALGYIALVSQFRVNLASINHHQNARINNLHGSGSAGRMVDFLVRLHPTGHGDFGDSVRHFLSVPQDAGICIVLSDFFDRDGCDEGLARLSSRGHDLIAIQVFSPQELVPPMRGSLRLDDMERNESADLSITPKVLDHYRQRLDQRIHEVETSLSRWGGGYFLSRTDQSLESLVLGMMRVQGLVK